MGDVNLQQLMTPAGLKQRLAYYTFLGHFSAGNGAALANETLHEQLQFISHQSWFASAARERLPASGLENKMRHGLMQFINATASGTLPLSNAFDPHAGNGLFTSTLQAFECGNQRLIAFMEAPNSPWFKSDYPRDETIAAISLGQPDLTRWLLTEDSPWPDMSATQRNEFVAQVEQNDALPDILPARRGGDAESVAATS